MDNKEFLTLFKNISDDDDVITTTEFIDTGSYIFNAALSGSLYGGFPSNRISVLAGDPATGKSFFAMSAVKAFLDKHSNGMVVYFDTEFALDKEFFNSRGIDAERVKIIQPAFLEDFKDKSNALIEGYLKMNEDTRPRMMIVLDSHSNLPSSKETTVIKEGEKQTRDMHKQQVSNSIFRILTQKLGKANVPMITTAHVYTNTSGYGPAKIISGGIGMQFSASGISMLSKAAEIEEIKVGGKGEKETKFKDVTGTIITATIQKSRFSREKKVVKTRLNFSNGLERYYGLLDLAIKHGIVKRLSTQIEWPDGRKLFEKTIYREPEKYFTPDIMEKLEIAANKEFKFGNLNDDESVVEDDELINSDEE